LLGRRLVAAVPVLLLVVVGAFLLLELSPGDAVDAYAVQAGGDAGFAADLRRQWGLDQGVAARLVTYLGALARLDLGRSVVFSQPVATVVADRLPVTLILMTAAVGISFIAGALIGVAAGARPGSLRDRVLSTLALALYAVPGFWLALVLVLAFAVTWRLLPVSGFETVASGKEGVARALDIARHLVLPASALGLIYLALYARVMRVGMAEVWRQDFVLALRARGITRRRTVWRHVARNALLPLVTMLGLQSASLVGGSVVIESIFALPGLGRLAQEAVAGRDAPLLVGVILVSAVVVIAVNLAVDVAYAALDPRVGSGEETAA
jgi:peptide/nickel transport system permease protein